MCFYRVALFKLHIRNFYIVTRVQSAVQADLSFSMSARSADTLLRHLTLIPIALINSCGFLYRQSLPIRCARDIRNFSRCALRSNVFRFLVNLQVKLTGTPGLYSEAWRMVPSNFSVLIFCVNTSFGTPGRTRKTSI